MRHLFAVVALAAGFCGPAEAGPVLDRIRTRNAIRCGAVERPGLAESRGGQARGLLVDLCRAAGMAAAGEGVRVDVAIYDADRDFDAIRSGAADLVFLSAGEIIEQRLGDRVLPGPTVFVEQTAVMAAAGAPARDLPGLAGATVCFEQGTEAQRSLEAWASAQAVAFVRMGYQEPDEEHDAFESRTCAAMAGEVTGLAGLRRGGGPVTRAARLLPTALGRFPIMAATGLDDPRWSAVVTWTIDTLMAADQPDGAWRAGGLASLPLGPIAPGQPPDWQHRLVAVNGSYAAILARNLGAGSDLGLGPGPNASGDLGGLMLAPLAE